LCLLTGESLTMGGVNSAQRQSQQRVPGRVSGRSQAANMTQAGFSARTSCICHPLVCFVRHLRLSFFFGGRSASPTRETIEPEHFHACHPRLPQMREMPNRTTVGTVEPTEPFQSRDGFLISINFSFHFHSITEYIPQSQQGNKQISRQPQRPGQR
jgi:hypothetical protein